METQKVASTQGETRAAAIEVKPIELPTDKEAQLELARTSGDPKTLEALANNIDNINVQMAVATNTATPRDALTYLKQRYGQDRPDLLVAIKQNKNTPNYLK